MASAIERADAMFGALGDAERQADAAMWATVGRFDPLWRDRRGMWLLYLWTGKHQRENAATILRQFHRARAIHRHSLIAETRGIDTSVPGWRGGRGQGKKGGSQ
jgi:hypothetical protein